MIGFYKSLGCPASDLLFDAHTKKLGAEMIDEIQSHADSCDFCGAELELYSNCPELDEGVKESEIPAHVRELAEFLLNNRHKDQSFLTKLLIEDAGLKLREVWAGN